MNDSDANSDSERAELAAAFGRSLDPLADFETTFSGLGIDVFGVFVDDVLEPQDLNEKTVKTYRLTFRQWREHMENEGRHPACPNEGHVKSFIRWRLNDHGNTPNTVKTKLRSLNRAFEYWQRDSAFPHSEDYNPFDIARDKVNLDEPEKKDPHRIPVDRLKEIIGGIDHIRSQAFVVLQLKLGLRASELINIQFSDLAIEHSDLKDHYPDLGTDPHIEGHENAIFIPTRDDRPGNKSRRPRVLPLDDESRRVLVRYMLIRPDAPIPEVFVSDGSYQKLTKEYVNDAWLDAFRPEFDETPDRRAVTSHFGRHYFSTFWRISQDLNRNLVKYMRGDKAGESGEFATREAIDSYLHSYYEDIEQTYRAEIYRLGV